MSPLKQIIVFLALCVGSWMAVIGLALAIGAYLGLLMPLLEQRVVDAAVLGGKVVIREIVL